MYGYTLCIIWCWYLITGTEKITRAGSSLERSHSRKPHLPDKMKVLPWKIMAEDLNLSPWSKSTSSVGTTTATDSNSLTTEPAKVEMSSYLAQLVKIWKNSKQGSCLMFVGF